MGLLLNRFASSGTCLMALNYYLKAFIPERTDDTVQGKTKKTKNNPVSSELKKITQFENSNSSGIVC